MDRVTPIRAGYEWSASCRTTDTVTGDPIPLSGGVLTIREGSQLDDALIVEITGVIDGDDSALCRFSLTGDDTIDYAPSQGAYFDVWLTPADGERIAAYPPSRIPILGRLSDLDGD